MNITKSRLRKSPVFVDDQPPINQLDADSRANLAACLAATPPSHPDYNRINRTPMDLKPCTDHDC